MYTLIRDKAPILIFFIASFIANSVSGQKVIKNEINHAKKVVINQSKKVVINQYSNNAPVPGSVLLLNKFLDTTKDICMKNQGNTLCNPFSYAKRKIGLGFLNFGGSNPVFLLKADAKGYFILNSTVLGIDGQVLSLIENNVINPKSNSALKQTSTDSSIRVLNQYGIPVLKINLHKGSNNIDFSCVTFSEDGNTLIIISDSGINLLRVFKPYLLMTQEEKDKWWYDCRVQINQYGIY